MNYQIAINIHHDLNVTYKTGILKTDMRCQCSRHCRTQMSEGDKAVVFQILNPIRNKPESFVACETHFWKHHRGEGVLK